MESDKEAIARLERKIENNRRDQLTFVISMVLLVGLLSTALKLDPVPIFVVLVAGIGGAMVIVFRRAWIGYNDVRNAREMHRQALKQSISELTEKQ